MAINVSQAFKRTSKNPIDETFALTKAQMLTVNDNLMPDYYFTVCQDDGCFYLYDKSATASQTTGKFAKFEGGTDSLAFGYLNETNGKFYKESTYTTEIAGNTGKLYITLDTNYIYRYDATNGFVQVGGGSTGGSVEGYLNPTNGKFYEDSTYTTEISGEVGKLYVTLDTNKVYRYDSTNGFVLVGGGDGETIQYDTMPTASSALVGTIVQYIGSTTATYTKGYWYECVLDGSTYKWQNIQVQEGGGESGSGISVTATLLAASWDAQNQQTVTFTGYQSSMNGVIGVPASATDAQKEAYSSALVRTVSQNGNQFTFECESIPSIDLPVTIYAGGASGGSTGGHTIEDSTGTQFAARSNLKFKGVTVTDDSTNDATVVEVSPIQYTVLPTADADHLGNIVQYIGADTSTLTNGFFYKCVSDGAATPTYSWEEYNVQEQTDISGKSDLSNLAAQFDDTVTYAIGDRCTYNGKLYRFTAAHTGAWVAGDVTEVTVDGEIPQELTAAQMQAIKDAFEPTVRPDMMPVLFDETGAERVVGWYKLANGTKKPLYQKTIDLGNFPNASTKYVDTGLDHAVVSVKNLFCDAVFSDGSVGVMPFFTAGADNSFAMTMLYSGTTGKISITTARDRSTVTGYATLQYTKNTD